MILSVAAVSVVALVAIVIGALGVRVARTTSDLFVASRAISPWWNAAAISGEYLSAASFLGIAGLEMQNGLSALWLPVGYAAGYLALLLFVAAPLRRLGAYTIADFAGARLPGEAVRRASTFVVLLIAGLYLVPQLKGAGITVSEVTGAPYWTGVIAVAGMVTLAVGLGGMRGITYVQGFQFWVKACAISIPAIALLIYLGGFPQKPVLFGNELPRAPATGLRLTIPSPDRVVFPLATSYEISGRSAHARAGEVVTLPRGVIVLPSRAAVPVQAGIRIQAGSQWSRPVASKGDARPLVVYSLLLATFLGTMGLPHILVRFYTNLDGRAARHTTVRVLGLLGFFYIFPGVYGLLGRVFVPGLYITGATDSVALKVPQAAWPGTGGEILAALLAAGAFAAFVSTSSGLLVSISGALAHDVVERIRPRHAPRDRRRRFRFAAPVGMVIPCLVALVASGIDITLVVGWAFAVAASTFCPLLLLGIWWSGLTPRAAVSGMTAGALTASAAITAFLIVGPPSTSFVGALLTEPAIVSVPVAFGTMIGMSIPDRRSQLDERVLLSLHAPEDTRAHHGARGVDADFPFAADFDRSSA